MQLTLDGRPCYAYTGGRAFDASLPAVVLVHGAQHDHSVWGLQSRYLAHHGYGVLAVDLPGHGRSGGAPLPDVEALADWIAAMIGAAGLRSAAVAGHSMGSLITLETAARHPALVERIALLATAFPMRVSAQLLEAARHDEPRAIDMINLWSHALPAPYPGNPGPGFSVAGINRRLMQRQKPGVLYNDFAACNAYSAGTTSAAQVKCPALLLLGQRDIMTPPRAARELAAALVDCRTLTIPGVGHNLMGEAPDAVLDALTSFFSDQHKAA